MTESLLIATNNPGKLREFERLLRGVGLDLVSPARRGLDLTVAESGATYRDNALAKAVAFSVVTPGLAIADDSGIELVDLGNWPGVQSVRFAGPDANDRDREQILLERLANLESPTRRARYVCNVAVAEDGVVLAEGMGALEGSISSVPRGEGGFGYDRIFIPRGRRWTVAELPPHVKDVISHRARALAGVRPFLKIRAHH